MSADLLLDRLYRVKKTSPNRYAAACPVCQSRKGRPLAITVLDDRILLKPFCGCDTENVLASVGLSFSSLFNRPLDHSVSGPRRSFDPMQVLTAVEHEVTVADLILFDVSEARLFSSEQHDRLHLAAARVSAAVQTVYDGSSVTAEIRRIRQAAP